MDRGYRVLGNGRVRPPGATPLPPVESPPVRVVAPVAVKNDPPVIQQIAVGVARAEVDQNVPVTATIVDHESPSSSLTYTWKANAGTFTGSGPAVTWRLAKGSVPTPVNVTISLEVTDAYQDFDPNGLPIPREHHVTAAAAPFPAHDSRAEFTKMGVDFLVTYFGHSDVSPKDCLVDFSDTCRGKADELGDIVQNRSLFLILNAEAHVDQIDFNPAMDHADITAPCTFQDRELKTGREGITIGNCTMAAVYKGQRWWLCDSHLRGSHTVLSAPLNPK